MDSKYAFISYSRKNEELVHKIVDEFESEGQKVFIDFRDIPPGSVFANEIVNAIENSTCCILMLSNESNNSNMVLNEVNSAVNHNKLIIPLQISDVELSKAMEFYIGKNNWINYAEKDSLKRLIDVINNIEDKKKENEIQYKGPIVLSAAELNKIGYDYKKIVTETIEIDYLTVGDAPMEYLIDSDIEGEPEEWFEYAREYPETASFLVVNDKVVGYSQIELVNDDNYNQVINCDRMIDASMEEFYGFGGEFSCYIAIMPILVDYENQSNYLLLINDIFNKFVMFKDKYDVSIKKIGISIYSNILEKIVTRLGFIFKGLNIAKGKVFELDIECIRKSEVIRRMYPDFYKMYGD